MIVQIYSLNYPEEALATVEAGADYIGVNPTDKNTDKTFDEALAAAKAVFQAIEGKAVRVALTIDNTPEERTRIIETLRPDILHISGAYDDATPELVSDLKSKFSFMKIMQAIPMTGPEAIEKAVGFSKFVDYLILDSVIIGVIGTGAAGITHDWNWSRAIVEKAHCNVILAGGLGPDNVSEAVRVVRPFGVDSLTRTNKKANNRSEKDIDKVRAFCENARRTAGELGLP